MAAFPSFTQIDNGSTSPNSSVPVMANLNAIVTFINTFVTHLDGAKAMTANLSSNGTDPVAANDMTRKSYVDALFATESVARLAGDKGRTRVGWGVRRVAVQTVTGPPTIDAVNFDTEDWDTDGFFAPTSTNITVPAGRGGIYTFYMELGQTNSTSGLGRENWILYLYINGVLNTSIYVNPYLAQTPAGGQRTYNTGMTMALLAPGDVVRMGIGFAPGSVTLNPNGDVVFIGERLSA